MGNQIKPLPIENFINKEIKPKKLEFQKKVEQELNKICKPYSYKMENFMLENSFKFIIQISDADIFNNIFDIFGRETEKKEKIITFEDIKYLYYSFTTSNPHIKAIVFAFLLFGNKKILPFNDFNNKIFKIFHKDIKANEFLISFCNDNINNNYEIFEIKDFINRLKGIQENKEKIEIKDNKGNKDKLEFFRKFKFIKEIPKASQCKLKSNNMENVNYICDCSNIEIDNNEGPLNGMRRHYDSLCTGNNRFLYLNDFQKSLELVQTHTNIIKLVIDFLKKRTLRDYCYFNDIKYIFTYLNYSVSINEKKIFLFKMLLKIYNQEKELTYNQIDKYLNINYDEKKSNETQDQQIKYDEGKFLSDGEISIMIDNLNPFLENFGLLPYLIFRVKTDDKKIKRRLINDTLKSEDINNYEKYIEKNFEDFDFFYAIDIKFWNTLMNENEDAPDFIDNSNIAEEISVVKEEDKLEEEIRIIELQNNSKNKKEEKKEKSKSHGKEEGKENKTKEEKNKSEENKEKEKDKVSKNNQEKENNNKETKKEENSKKPEIISKQARLKKGLKYKKDFFLVCGQLYQILKTHYKMNYIIRLIKIETQIDLNPKIKKEDNNKEKGDIEQKSKEENKKEENKEEKKETQNENNEEKKETQNENNEETKKENIEEKKEKIDSETSKEEVKETIEAKNNSLEESKNVKDEILNEKEKNPEKLNEEKIQEEDIEMINNKKLVKEKLNNFIVDEEQGLISKLVATQDKNIYILNELDFYPIQVYQKSLGIMVRTIEKAKIMYEKLEKRKHFVGLTEKEQRKIYKQREKEGEILDKKIQKYYELKDELIKQWKAEILSQNDYEIKRKELYDEFEEIFQKREKDQNDYEVDITLKEFTDNLVRYKNSLLIDKRGEINIYPRYKTFKDIKNAIISKNPFLKEKTIDIYYFLFSTGTLFKPKEDFSFENIERETDGFINIIVDIYSDKGESFYNLLANKEEMDKEKEKLKKQYEEKHKSSTKKETKKPEKNKNKTGEKDKKKLSEIDKNEIKEEKKLDKLEKERLEKERKEKEKEQKQKEKKEREEQEKLKKEEEKIRAKREKIRKQKEKEAMLKQKQLQKERELEIQRQKELERKQFPPYGIINYGNTCYFNSVNQIFLNLPILQKIFLDERINCFINRTNKFGHEGKFIDIFKTLYWIKHSKVGENVLNLKKIVGKIKEDFNNNRQQDANEYLNFVLDSLHEELNLHSTKIYIEEKDDLFLNNTEEEMGNLLWSYNLKRNTSFIDSIFMFQLKSNLKCRKCQTKKYNFENNYIFDLPLSLCKMVTVEIYLYRLPFRYKLYFDKIDKNFSEYIQKEENKNHSIVKNLWNYYINVLTIEEKNKHVMKLHFSFDLEREKKMLDITKILRGIKILELEPENLTEVTNNDNIIEYKMDQITDFITYSKEKNKIIFPNSDIDKFVNSEDKIILNVYEVLNSKGMQLLLEEDKLYNINLYSYFYKKPVTTNLDTFRDFLKNSECMEDKKETNCGKETFKVLTLNEKMIVFPKEIIRKETKKSRQVLCEYAIPIFHYWITKNSSSFLFRDSYHINKNIFPVQYIILNNIDCMPAKKLYEYVWNLNVLYMNHPNIDTKNFWWNQKEQLIEKTKGNNEEEKNKEQGNINIKKCYPFVLRYLEIPEKKENFSTNLIHCPLCPWYSFCPGCIIDPDSNLEKLNSNMGVVVDWCTSYVNDEIDLYNFQLSSEIDNQVISENLPMLDKNQNYQSINDCFNLFFEEENLEDPLYCRNCKGPEDFSKCYSINRLPYVLILSLKRFKFNENSNFKLRQMITYPLYDLEIPNDSSKTKYDLYGVINHYGSINSGHYTCIIKNIQNEWILCNDSSVSKIEEKRVMHANAYILFYISKESPYKNDYIRFMKSLMDHIIIKDEKGKKFAEIKDDLNFFRGEPVKTDYGEGYVCKDNLVDFSEKERYDILKELEKKEDERIEILNKKYKKDDKSKKETKEENNVKENKDKENNVEENKDKENNVKENKDKENNVKENKDKENSEDINKKDINNKDDKEKKSETNKIKEENNENKIIENNENKNIINEEGKDKKEENEENKENSTETKGKKNENIIPDKQDNSSNKINEKENTNKTIGNTNKEEKHEDCYTTCPGDDKNYVEIKFDYEKKWVLRTKVKKYNNLKHENEEKTKKK